MFVNFYVKNASVMVILRIMIATVYSFSLFGESLFSAVNSLDESTVHMCTLIVSYCE